MPRNGRAAWTRRPSTVRAAIQVAAIVLLLAVPSALVRSTSLADHSLEMTLVAPGGMWSPSSAAATLAPLTWTELLPEGSPPSSYNGSPVLAYDPLTQQTLDFVSATYQDVLTSVWSFDAGLWTNVTPGGNLTHQGLTQFSATFDTAASALLLFGYADQPSTAETWTYSAAGWSLLQLAAEPTGTPMVGLTYDPRDASAILLTTLYPQPSCLTWAFQGGNWTQLSTADSPPALYGSTMTFDNSTADQEIVLFTNGIQSAGPSQGFWNQTWVFRGGQWINVTATSGAPPPSAEGAMTYDSSDQLVLLAQGAYNSSATLGKTWTFSYGRWGYLSSPSIVPYVGSWSNFAFDAHDNYSVLVVHATSQYTGNATTETWKFDHTALDAPPTVALNVTPRNLTGGAKVQITASASGGFGLLGVLVQISLPGCFEAKRLAGSWECATNGGGPGFVSIRAVDQAGRSAFAFVIVNITAPPAGSVGWLTYALIGVPVLAGVSGGAAFLVWRRGRNRSKGSDSPPSTPGSSGGKP